MAFIEDQTEAVSILGMPLDGPVYKTVREDADGSEVAVPVFRIREKDSLGHFQKRWRWFMSLFAVVLLLMVLVWLVVLLAYGLTAKAEGPGYEYIEQTEDPEVIALTEAVAEEYPICPELLQAVIFFESSNRRSVVSQWGDIGLMQINPRWQQARMDKLGISDLQDGYGNVLVGADLLCELFAEYEDTALVLMCYNIGTDKAVRLYNAGQISDYAKNILELSEQLERLHGK